jgi:putative tricarboxylic transport membrane protein
VLAQMLETSLSQSLLISQGSIAIFFTRPISLFFMVLAFASIARGIWVTIKTGGPEIAEEDTD